jgi:hypothetical protein
VIVVVVEERATSRACALVDSGGEAGRYLCDSLRVGIQGIFYVFFFAYGTNSQSLFVITSSRSGRDETRLLYTLPAEASSNLPPSAARLRTWRATIGAKESLWKA